MPKTSQALLAALIALHMPAVFSAESTNQWYLRGPDGGYASQIGIDRVSNRPIAGGLSGVFRYDAFNGFWDYANAGAPTPVVAAIATTPTATFINSDGYVARSTDGGVSWTTVSNAAMAGKVASLATSAASGTRVYATVNPHDPTNSDLAGGLWISNDLGNTWTQSAQTVGGNMGLVRASPTNASLIMVAGSADASGVTHMFRSTDAGVTFAGPVANTAGSPSYPLDFVDAAQDPFNANHWIALAAPTSAAFTDKSTGGEMWTSIDAGQNWTRLADNFLISPETSGGGEPRAVFFDRFNAGTVYFATTWGVFKSTGGTATLSATGLLRLGSRLSGAQPYDEVSHLEQANDGNHTLYAATISGGIFSSTNSAATWSPLTAGYGGLNFRMFAFQPGNTGVVLGGAADPSTVNGVYRSTDGGTTWSRSANGMNANNIRGLAFAPPPNQNIVLAAGLPQQFIGGENNAGVWRSIDAGLNWTAVTTGLRLGTGKRILQFDPGDVTGQRVLLASAGALSLSTNAGVSWINSKDQAASFGGLPMMVVGNTASMLGLAAGPGPVAGTRFYGSFDGGPFPSSPPAGGAGGVYYSDDGGYHWTVSAGLPDDSASYFSMSPTAGTLFVAKVINGSTRQGGVFKSTDYGQNFIDSSNGLPCRDIFTVAADPSTANVVWTGCRYSDIAHPGGIFRSNDGGANWVPYGRGLRNQQILWMSVDPADSNHVLAGGLEGIHEMHFAADADQDGIPDSEETSVAGGDANGDGTQDSGQANVASTGIPLGSIATAFAEHVSVAGDYVVVEIDNTQPKTGACQFVSDLAIVPLDQIPLSNRMLQAAPTVRFILPNCQAATVKIRYSAVTTYPVAVFGSFSPVVAGDATTIGWGLFDASRVSVNGVSGTWSVQLAQNSYGNVYAPNSGSILFQGAPGKDSIFGSSFE